MRHLRWRGVPLLQGHGLARDPGLRHGRPQRPVDERRHRPRGVLRASPSASASSASPACKLRPARPAHARSRETCASCKSVLAAGEARADTVFRRKERIRPCAFHMKWLDTMVDVPEDPAGARATRLRRCTGHRASKAVETLGASLDRVVTGQGAHDLRAPSLTRDHMWVTTVDVRRRQPRRRRRPSRLQIVCGAPERARRATHRSPSRLVGTELPGGVKIKKSEAARRRVAAA